ncbi:MAG: hypothetical protein PVI21_05685 [Candidatus Woesebacteria bacterium]|jgi:hypothetical protein
MKSNPLRTLRAIGRASSSPSLVDLLDEATLQKGVDSSQRMILVDGQSDRGIRGELEVVSPATLDVDGKKFSLRDVNVELWKGGYIAATMYEFYYYLAKLWDPAAVQRGDLIAYGTLVFPQFDLGGNHIFVVSKMCGKRRQTWQEVMCESSLFSDQDRFLVVRRKRRRK